ncbi:MAG: hypothetical protein WDO68_22735 [Gammaproteobacteria bacterium]
MSSATAAGPTYGSDAVAGVVNFILDENFKGFSQSPASTVFPARVMAIHISFPASSALVTSTDQWSSARITWIRKSSSPMPATSWSTR